MSASIDTLLSRLDGVRQSKANSWMARCPAHNGDGRSMAVTHADDGRILIHCFAYQCDVSDILAAIGMSVGELFPEPLPKHHYGPRKHGVSPIDVLGVMRHELAIVELIVSDLARGEPLNAEIRACAFTAAGRIRKALDLCNG